MAGPHAASVDELRAQIEAERSGRPFLVYRDDGGAQRVVLLVPSVGKIAAGRQPSAQISLPWDEKVSRLHAELEPVAEDWVLVDDGLSRNGSYVNGERVSGRRVLVDRDVLRFGRTEILFRRPRPAKLGSTAVESVVRPVATLTQIQRDVLVALCRPFKGAPGFAVPASNQQIAREVHLSVDAVKAHLRVLFEKFGVSHLPPNKKRVRLVEVAFQRGAVTEREL
jgi:pSer/pThr/pTyr-binding forkhead associated (FHA) protein